MPQVTVADISTGSADANTLDITHIVATDEVLVVGVVLEIVDAAKDVLSVTWDQGGGDQASLSNFTVFSPTHSKLQIEVWRITNPVAKTATVRITIEGGNSQKIGGVCVSLADVDTTTPLEGAATDEGTGSAGSVSVTQEADDLAFCFAGFNQTGGTFAPGGGETEHADFDVIGFDMWAASEDGSAATTLSWTHSGNKEHSTLGFNINAAPGAVILTPAPVTTAWSAPVPTLQIGGVTLEPLAVSATWVVPAATIIVLFILEGVTRDVGGAVLANVRCVLFKQDGAAEASRIYTLIDHVNSDGSGNYKFVNVADNDPRYCVVAINQGADITSGVTDDDLVPVLS